jgi:hypothetical protein
MIRIRPQQLNFAAALGRIRRRPPGSAGAGNALRYHQLSYDGGPHLTFATTDFRVSMVSRLSVEGQSDPWECRVPFDNFNAFALDAEGGKLTLNPGSPPCVRAEKWSPKEIDAFGREFFFAYPSPSRTRFELNARESRAHFSPLIATKSWDFRHFVRRAC